MTHDRVALCTIQDECIRMSAPGVELLLDVSSGYPVVLHWGASTAGVTPAAARKLADGGASHGDLDVPVDPGMLREGARGFTGRPALRGHRGTRDFSPLFHADEPSVEGDIGERSAAVLHLSDAAAGLALELRLTMTSQGVLLIDATLTNTGHGVYTLDELAVWLPVPDRATHTLDFAGRWLRERQPHRLPMVPGLRLREGREGRTGHDSTIVQCAVTDATTTEAGEAWGLALLWSGDTVHMAERDQVGRRALGAGELLEPGEAELAPGESYTAPTVAALYSDQGLDGMGSSAHEWLRARPEHPDCARPITLNVWEAVYYNHDLATLTALADRAAQVGIERFVLDDGWFGSRRDATSGLGDWVVSPVVWPDGLLPFADHVKSLGMQFGLWFEGEMVNPDSDVYRAHPDWILRVSGRIPPLARHQLVLDLTHPDAFAYVLNAVHAVISRSGVDYIKWDHNRRLTDAGHAGSPATHAQTQATYRLFDQLRLRNPGLEIESCASGGGRIDLGMAMHADRFWTSDQNDALERQHIQRWTSLVIPPEMLGTHIGPAPSHSTGRVHSVNMRAVTALFGHAGVEFNLLDATDEELAALARWASFYREHRGLLHRGRVVRVDHPDPTALVHGVVAQDAASAIFAYVQCATTSGTRPSSFRLPGLDPGVLYRVRGLSFGRRGEVAMRSPAWVEHGVEATGAALAAIGLRAPILWPEEALLVVVERADA